MNRHLNRDDEYIADLTHFLRDQYSLDIKKITQAKRGFWGETWKADAEAKSYFVKIDHSDFHKPFYKESLSVISQLRRNGIAHICNVITASDGNLSTAFKDGVVGVFDYEYGDNHDDYDAAKVFEKLIPIYKVSDKISHCQKEPFSPEYADFYFDFVNDSAKHRSFKDLDKIFEGKSELMRRYADRLKLFARRSEGIDDHFYITHGDAGGNVIVNGDNLVIVDWDYPMLAPVERDAWFSLHNEKKLSQINKLLNNSGMDYKLEPNRLAFYAYFSLFYYFHECFRCLIEFTDENRQKEFASEIPDLFSCWITERLDAADKID